MFVQSKALQNVLINLWDRVVVKLGDALRHGRCIQAKLPEQGSLDNFWDEAPRLGAARGKLPA